MTEQNDDDYCDLHDLRHEEGCECDDMKEKRLITLNQDQQLQLDIKEGRITADQVAEIWRKTEDLSPQTNINARRQVIALRELGKGRGPIEALAAQFPVFVNMVLKATNETQAAMMRDESKFAHLVAGAEMVAKSMEQLGTIAAAYEKIQDRLNDIEDLIVDQKLESNMARRRWWQFWKYIPDWRDHEPEGEEMAKCYHCGSTNLELDSFSCFKCTERYEKSKDMNGVGIGSVKLTEEAIPTDDPAAEKARKRTIGSAWANRMPD